MIDLGSASRFLAALGGLWDRAEQYLPLILSIALPLAALVFTFSMLQAFFQDDTEEAYFRIMGRFGITLAILDDYRSLFEKFNQLSADLAHHFADPNSFQSFFQQFESRITGLNAVISFTSLVTGSIVTLLTLLSAVVLVLAYLGLVLAQAIAVILLYVFGPLLIALLPNRHLSSVTYGYVRAFLQVLLWPAVWSIVLALFTGALLEVFVGGPIVNLVPAILLILLSILLTQIPRLTGYITSGALHATGTALSEVITAGMAYLSYKAAETGASVAIAAATGGAAVTVPQAIGYMAKSRSSGTTQVPPRTNFTPLPPPTPEAEGGPE
jgi:hypothetical protein